jgi:hypothetical protein
LVNLDSADPQDLANTVGHHQNWTRSTDVRVSSRATASRLLPLGMRFSASSPLRLGAVSLVAALFLGACGNSISDAPDVADLPRPTTTPPPKPIACVVDKGTKDGDGLKLTKSGLTIGGKAGEKPTIKVPKSDAPKDVICEVMVEGTGARVATGDTIKANYVGVVRKTGKQFDASYDRGEPASFPVGVGGLIPGWDRTLVGLKYGSKVVLSIPPADGYGVNGNAGAGIAGDDTLIFVIEIIEKVEQTPEPAAAPSSVAGSTVAGTTAAATTVAG